MVAPKETLKRRLKKLYTLVIYGNIDTMRKNDLGRFRTVLSNDQDKQLAKYIIVMDKAFFELTILDIKDILVYKFCERNKILNYFSNEKKLYGRFCQRVLKKKSTTVLAKTTRVALNRVYELNLASVKIMSVILINF